MEFIHFSMQVPRRGLDLQNFPITLILLSIFITFFLILPFSVFLLSNFFLYIWTLFFLFLFPYNIFYISCYHHFSHSTFLHFSLCLCTISFFLHCHPSLFLLPPFPVTFSCHQLDVSVFLPPYNFEKKTYKMEFKARLNM